MLVASDSNSIQRGGIAGEKVFGFVFSKKMYDLMSTNLYSDRIGSTVREICSNAWDGHKAAGKENEPFNITLPTNLEPHFIVEDFGTGMPDDRAQELYSTLGLSTKEQSNDMIGAFGLGSKVPFTVTDSFSVENTYEGKTYFYLCFKNEKGFPSILKTGEVDTENGNGVKVVIPVAGAKYTEFLNAMKRQLIMMDPKPHITNAGAFTFPEARRVHELPSGFILENAWDFNLPPRNVYAKMGIVLYPIDLDQVGIRRGNRYHESFTSSSALILNFGIGDLDPVPSREGLTYDLNGKTIENITKKYESYKQELLEKVTADIKKETHTYTAWQMVLDTTGRLGINIATISNPIVINGYTIGNTIHSFKRFDYQHTYPDYDDGKGGIVKGKTTTMTDYPYKYDSRSRWSYHRKIKWDKDTSITAVDYNNIRELVSGNALYVLMDEDVPKKKLARMNKVVDDNKGKEVRFVHMSEHMSGDKCDFTEFKKVYDDFYPGLSGKFISFKSIVVPKKDKAARDETVFKGVKFFQDPYSYEKNMPLDMELDGEEVFYITSDRDTLIDYPTKTIKDMRLIAYEIGCNMILVRKSGVKAIAQLEKEGVKEFKEFVRELMDGAEFSEKFKKKASAQKIYETYIEHLQESEKQSIRASVNDLNDDGKEYVKLYNEADKIHKGFFALSKVEKLLTQIQTSGLSHLFQDDEWIKASVTTFYEEFLVAYGKFNLTYPLFFSLSRATNPYPYRSTETIQKYVRDMNELAYHRASLDNLAGRLERLRQKQAVNVVNPAEVTLTVDVTPVLEPQNAIETELVDLIVSEILSEQV